MWGRNFCGMYSLWRNLPLFQTPTTRVSGMRPSFTSRATVRCTIPRLLVPALAGVEQHLPVVHVKDLVALARRVAFREPDVHVPCVDKPRREGCQPLDAADAHLRKGFVRSGIGTHQQGGCHQHKASPIFHRCSLMKIRMRQTGIAAVRALRPSTRAPKRPPGTLRTAGTPSGAARADRTASAAPAPASAGSTRLELNTPHADPHFSGIHRLREDGKHDGDQ